VSSSDRRTIILCVGNELIADDAVGFEVFTRLERCLDLGRIRLEYCGVGGIDMLPLLENETDLIVVDAIQLGAEAGMVHVIPWYELPVGSAAISAHGLGLRETMEIGMTLYPGNMPERVTLVGIEGRCFNRTREFMTQEVENAIPRAVSIVRNLVQGGNNEHVCL
jgi:hydrogenase maturation protease